MAGFHDTILWIDLTARTHHWEQRPESFFRHYAGGALLAAQLLLEHTPAGLDAFDPRNLLIFAGSVAAGQQAAGLARFSVCAKSPLTGGIGEARCEGPWAMALKRSGAGAIVFSGRAVSPVAVVIEDGRVAFRDAAALWGMQTGAATDALEQALGEEAAVAAIGPAGESRVRFASIVTGRCHQAARMGMGAVMGSKNLKAVAIIGGEAPAPADPSALARLTGRFAAAIPSNDLSRWQKDPPGFSCWVHLHGLDCALCVRNYSQSTVEDLDRLSTAEFLKRVNGVHPCPGCPNGCIQRIHPLSGADGLDPRASGIHQEVTGTMGPNLGITDLDWILRANNLCNQLGMDPVSLGYTLSFAMELRARGMGMDGFAEFGDHVGAETLLRRIARREGPGDLLAEGSRRAALRIGGDAVRYAMHVKGLEMVCFEPRSQTGLALGYATAPVGPRYDICEHDWDFDTKTGWPHSLRLARTLGIEDRIPMNALGAEKARRYKQLSNLWSAADAMGLCLFASAPTRIFSMPEMASMVAAVTGWETSDYEFMRWGERRNHLLRLYNLREELTAADDTLPDRFFDEPIGAGPRAGDVLDRAAFHDTVRSYYRLMGWDDDGVPLPATRLDYGISAS